MFRKFATAAIIGAEMGTDAGFAKSAHRAVFNYVPREGYLYVRSRAISSRCNDNFDMFPADEIAKAYGSFIGKPVFVNHHNEDHRRARGVIIDAALHKDVNPDGSPDTWVELLHEVDAVKFPKLAKAILAGEVNRTSMGCDVKLSKCSACGNVATSPLEYCQHIPGKKGKRIFRVNASTGAREGQLIFEICSGLSFFENSLLVEQPADPTAYFLGNVELGPGLSHLSKAASRPRDPMFYWRENHRPFDLEQENSSWQKTASQINPPRVATAQDASATSSRERAPMPNVWELIKQADLTDDDSLEDGFVAKSSLEEDWEESLEWHRLGNVQPPTNSMRRQAQLNDPNPQPPLVRPAKPKGENGKTQDYSKEDNTAWNQKTKAHADEWAKRNPVHPQNIIDHWNAATPDEKENGKTWYSDAHHTARALAKDTGTPLHTMAGLISNYSPQTHWATNVITAAKTARIKQGLGGGGNNHGFSQFPEGHARAGQTRGIMASAGQKAAAEHLLKGTDDEDESRANGSHYEKVLKGPKTQAFARLIHNGGDDHSVVVDRHAYSVASGARASDAAYGHSGLGGKKKYNEVSDAYKAAAQHISAHEGETIHPHQVQAATWLVRQRMNEEGDQNLANKGRTSAAGAHRAMKEMHQYFGEHHPEASTQMPGTGYSKETGLVEHQPTGSSKTSSASPNFKVVAYGETKAPQDVDTLRSENCTVCGNSTAFDGKQCQVCGYVAPPKVFGDPNTDVARGNDVRKQILDGDEADPTQTDQPLGNQVGNPDEAQEQADDTEAGDNPYQAQPLTCTNCGTSVTPPPPPEGATEPPYPADGDICPVCKQGELSSSSPGGEEGEDSEEGDDDTDQNGDGVPDNLEDGGDTSGNEDEDTPDDSDEDDSDDEDDDSKKKKGNDSR